MKDPAEFLDTFLVGGAVRDKILGEPIGDQDWVVIGATKEKMETLGFKSVGKDFPVFLHPITGEEYALARREQKVGKGYRGFKVEADPSVTIEEDLRRRDLTVNALALSGDGRLIDPFGGVSDLKAGKLRHVSPAFVEDPVRVLRVARLATRFAGKGFEIASETEALIGEMVQNGELNSLVPERIWVELARALNEQQPSVFFRVLQRTGALACVLPEIDLLFEVCQPNTAKYHEHNVGHHMLLALDASALVDASTQIRFAILVRDLGNSLSIGETSNINHELSGVNQVRSLCSRLRVPTDYRELAMTVRQYRPLMSDLFQVPTNDILQLLKALNVFHTLDQVKSFVLACKDTNSLEADNNKSELAAEFLIGCAKAAREVDLKDLGASFKNSKDRGRVAKQRRLAAIANTLADWKKKRLE